MKMLSNVEITKVCEEYLDEIWGEKLIVPVKIDGRLQKALGYFSHYDEKRGRKESACVIKFAKKLFDYNEETVKSVILHELTHYVLYIRGSKEYADGKKEFEDELRRIGSHSTETIVVSGKIYVVKCSKCGKIVGKTSTKRTANSWVKNYISGCCDSKLEIVEENIKDTNKPRKCEVKTKDIADILRKN